MAQGFLNRLVDLTFSYCPFDTNFLKVKKIKTKLRQFFILYERRMMFFCAKHIYPTINERSLECNRLLEEMRLSLLEKLLLGMCIDDLRRSGDFVINLDRAIFSEFLTEFRRRRNRMINMVGFRIPKVQRLQIQKMLN